MIKRNKSITGYGELEIPYKDIYENGYNTLFQSNKFGTYLITELIFGYLLYNLLQTN